MSELIPVASFHSGSDAASTTFTPTLPPHSAGDLIVGIVGIDGTSATAITASAGWNPVDSGGNTDTVRCAYFHKVASSSSETPPTFTSASVQWSVEMVTVRNQHGTPIDSAAITSVAIGATATSAALNTNNNNCLVLYGFVLDCGANDRAYSNPSDMSYLSKGVNGGTASVLTMLGYRVQAVAGAAASFAVANDVSNGGYAITIAIRANTSVGALMRVGGVTVVKRFTAGDTLPWSAPSGGFVSGTIAGIALDTSAPTADTSGLANVDWGQGIRFSNSANLGADAWVGGRGAISSTDFTVAPFALSFSVSSVIASRIGAEGVIVILASSSGNWKAYRMRKLADMAGGATYTRVIDASTATTVASAGTVDLTAVTEFYIMYHRKSGSTGACNLTFRGLMLLTEASIVGSSPSAFSFQSISTLINGWYDGTWMTVQGKGQILARQKMRIGNGTNKTIFAASGSSFETPLAYSETNKILDSDIGTNKLGITVQTSSNDVINLGSSIESMSVMGTLTIDATSSIPASFSAQGLTLIGVTPSWKTGFDATGFSVANADEFDAKGATLTSVTVSNSVSTGSAMKLDAGASLQSCTFTKGSETYALRIPSAGTYSINSTIFNNYTTAINVTATTGTVTINLATGQTQPTYTSAGATVVFVYPAIYFKGPNYANGVNYQLARQQLFNIASSAINTSTDEITLGNDTDGVSASLDIAISGFHSLIQLNLAAGATMPTTTPQIVDGGTYRIKTNSSGVVTLSVTEGGTTIDFVTSGTNNGSGVLFTANTETYLAHGTVSGGAGLSVALNLPTGARVQRKAIHYTEVSGATETSTLFDNNFIWSSSSDTIDGATISKTASPWGVPNQVGTLSSVVLAYPVTNINGTVFNYVVPKNAGSLVTGFGLSLEGIGKIQLNTSDADGLVVAFDLAVWFPYFLSTAQGLWLCDANTMTLSDLFNYTAARVEVDETSGTFTQFVGVNISGMRVATTTTGCVALNIATRGNGAITGSSGATLSQIESSSVIAKQASLQVINVGVQNASRLIPHATNL